jgi:hypothetical protein
VDGAVALRQLDDSRRRGASHAGTHEPISVYQTCRAIGFRFNTMTHRAAVEDSLTPEQVVTTLRAMVGSRRKLPVAYPLIDVLIHGQDIAIPLGIEPKEQHSCWSKRLLRRR